MRPFLHPLPFLSRTLIMLTLVAFSSGCPATEEPAVVLATSSADADVPASTDHGICLALGGGGANGLAHIAILAAFEELDLRPAHMAGTSIGAVIGALFAAGISTDEIRTLVQGIVAEEINVKELLRNGQGMRWVKFLEPDLDPGGLLESDAFIDLLRETIQGKTFDELSVPLQVVAADQWTREEVILGKGDVAGAVQASMAVPGLFKPVSMDGRFLVDGGLVNPVPYDILFNQCEHVVAVNVTGKNGEPTDISSLDSMFMAFQTMQESIVREKLRRRMPDIYIETDIVGVRMMQFHKLSAVEEQAGVAKKDLKAQLQSLVSE